MEVNGQLHALAALPPGKSLRYPLSMRLDAPQDRSGRRAWRLEKSCHYRDSNSYPLAVHLVASRYTDCSFVRRFKYIFSRLWVYLLIHDFSWRRVVNLTLKLRTWQLSCIGYEGRVCSIRSVTTRHAMVTRSHLYIFCLFIYLYFVDTWIVVLFISQKHQITQMSCLCRWIVLSFVAYEI
jgi:hypothetical protein